MFAVDANVLVHATNDNAREHERCRALLERWRAGAEPWCCTWTVLYEYLRVTTHPKVLEHPLAAVQAWAFVASILESPAFRVLVATDRHAEILGEVLRGVPLLSGNILHDVHIAVLLREHGVRRIYTRDTDFHRFAFLEVVDPMTG